MLIKIYYIFIILIFLNNNFKILIIKDIIIINLPFLINKKK